jgi:hypothetical protein
MCPSGRVSAAEFFIHDCFEGGQVADDGLPHAVEPDVGVPVGEDVAEIADLAPPDRGMARLERVGEMAPAASASVSMRRSTASWVRRSP